MFEIAILIGVYSYLIFFLGIFGLLYKNIIIYSSLVFIFFIFIVRDKSILLRSSILWEAKKYRMIYLNTISSKIIGFLNNNKLILFFILLLIFQFVVNLIGALGPELAFDALWYHLTLPKLYLMEHKIFFIPGGLLYYSSMPKLTEMIYIPALLFGGEVAAKLIHFSFGALTCFALYKISRKFLSFRTALLCVVIFYSNLVVDWESITAYIDLARTFFELMALWGFINWWQSGKRKELIQSAIILGLAISTKLLAFGSLFIFTSLILYKYIVINRHNRADRLSKALLIYWFISILAVSPWLVFSYVNTGNLIYPFFSSIYNIKINAAILNPFNFIKDVWNLFTQAADPISPIYIVFLPLIIYFFKDLKREIKVVALYSFLALIVWYLTPRTGGGRFILPYLSAFSLLTAAVLQKISSEKRFDLLKIICLGFLIIISIISILYRGLANLKYLPVILEKERKSEFLTGNLNFSFGDFYDVNSDIKNIVKGNRVLLFGFHNLYYADFPFIDASWVKKGDKFAYVAAQSTDLPKRFIALKLVYTNRITHVKLYSTGGKEWVY